ncbi:MAG: hypothetical protein WCT04_06230 [Planctomycetota bacterium]
MKTPNQVQTEIDALVDSWPLTKLEQLKIGNTFVCASDHFTRTFGRSSYNLFKVVSKAKTLLRCGVVYGPESDPSEVRAITYKSADRNRSLFRRATFSDFAKAEVLLRARTDAFAAEERWRKNLPDVYVLWNDAIDHLGSESKGDILHRTRSGFVLEVYDGNGKLHERVRMLADSDAGLDCADCNAIERMVRAYAASHFNRVNIKNGSKFHIQHVPQMD